MEIERRDKRERGNTEGVKREMGRKRERGKREGEKEIGEIRRWEIERGK